MCRRPTYDAARNCCQRRSRSAVSGRARRSRGSEIEEALIACSAKRRVGPSDSSITSGRTPIRYSEEMLKMFASYAAWWIAHMAMPFVMTGSPPAESASTCAASSNSRCCNRQTAQRLSYAMQHTLPKDALVEANLHDALGVGTNRRRIGVEEVATKTERLLVDGNDELVTFRLFGSEVDGVRR